MLFGILYYFNIIFALNIFILFASFLKFWLSPITRENHFSSVLYIYSHTLFCMQSILSFYFYLCTSFNWCSYYLDGSWFTPSHKGTFRCSILRNDILGKHRKQSCVTKLYKLQLKLNLWMWKAKKENLPTQHIFIDRIFI